MAYKPNTRTGNQWTRFRNILNQKPGEYESPWEAETQARYDQIAQAKPYEYDFNQDPLYQQYKSQYTAGAQAAMDMGNLLTDNLAGGYTPTYAAPVGQQTYGAYMDRMGDILPQLEQNAYARNRGEMQNAYELYGLARGREQLDYGMYRDRMADWQGDRQQAYGAYADQRGFDYGNYVDQRNFDYASMLEDREYADAKAAKAAASRGRGGGGGRRGKDDLYYLTEMQVGSAYFAYQNRGEEGLLKYLDELEAAGVPSDALADLYTSTKKNTEPIDWGERGPKTGR